MAKRVKVTAKELKQPDKFREAVGNAINYVSENYKKILLAFGVVVVVAAGVYAVNFALEKRKLNANSEFSEAVEIYEAGNKEKALKQFLAVRRNHPQADVSNLALYYAATINYETGKYDEAIKLYNEFLKGGAEGEMLRDSAYLALGLASFNKGEWQKAIDSLSRLDTDGSPYRNQAKLHIGLSLEKLGKYGEAEEVYKELLSGNVGY